jgi:hypothetical protein
MKTQRMSRRRWFRVLASLMFLVPPLSLPVPASAQQALLPSAPRPQLDLRVNLAVPLPADSELPDGSIQAAAAVQPAAPPAPALQIVILEGENALNNIKDRTAREPIIQVQDENHKPVAGASVIFTIQGGGGHAGAVFAHGATTFTGQTDSTGRLVAHGFRPNAHVGQFHVAVSASKGNLLSHAVIVQQNVVAATAATTSTGIVGVITTHIVVATTVAAGVVAGAVVTGVVLTRTPQTSINSGTGSVGAPQPAIRIRFGSHP